MKKKALPVACSVVCAVLMTLALGLDMGVARKARPDATDIFGYLYQAIARTAASISMDRLTAALVFVVCVGLCLKYLFCKPEGTGLGEYGLCAFLSLMMLLNLTVRTQDTVAVLWANAFQVIKAALYFIGVFLLLLTLLRALRSLLHREHIGKITPELARLEESHPVLLPALIIAIAWLPQIVIRYPGVLMWDSYMQIKQFMGEAERWSNHPPFGTLLYGTLAWLGEALQCRNVIYFCFTALQCVCYIAVLAYSIAVMRKVGAPLWVRLGALTLYALSPCYAGWATVIAKDTTFQISFLLMVTLLLEEVYDRKAFWAGWKRPLMLAASFLVMALSRHNGTPLILLVTVAMLFQLLHKKAPGAVAKLLLSAGMSLLLAFGIEDAISLRLGIQDAYMQDVMSLPFQQTARVVKLHGEEIPTEEREAINAVLHYDLLAENYNDWYADSVKDTYRQTATLEDRMAYWRVWWAQLKRWPTVYLDAALHMNGVLFDLQDNVPMYISFSDMKLDTYVYPWSFNDMEMYDREALVPLNSIQRAITEWYMSFDRIPFIGMFATMGFNVVLMLALCYISVTEGRRGAGLVWLPALVTLAICVFSPVVYLRYALPIVGSVPLGAAAYYAARQREEPPRQRA